MFEGLQRRDICRLSGRVRVPGIRQRPHELALQRRHLGAQRLVLLGVAGKYRRNCLRHLIGGGGRQPTCRDRGRGIGRGQRRADIREVCRRQRHHVGRRNDKRHLAPPSIRVI
ncbi:PE-PGRS family domain protein [Mycobacterium kansasii]|uniref:PE-PGRS family domain protein n=1 Tax=Mycobacterium kansasii TaxID=1768 RepID=A0A1V3WH58_MYCKA|nr:PE-PGRS family domain protein [Mycobacterium kansasii]